MRAGWIALRFSTVAFLLFSLGLTVYCLVGGWWVLFASNLIVTLALVGALVQQSLIRRWF